MYGENDRRTAEVSPAEQRAIVEKMVKTPINIFMAVMKIFVIIFSVLAIVGLVKFTVDDIIPLFKYSSMSRYSSTFRYSTVFAVLSLAGNAVTAIQLIFGILVGAGVCRTVFSASAKGARMAATYLKRTVVLTIIIVVLNLITNLINAVNGNDTGIEVFLISTAIVVGVLVLYCKYMNGWAYVLEDVAHRIEGMNVFNLPVSVSIKGPAITMASFLGLLSILVIANGKEVFKAASSASGLLDGLAAYNAVVIIVMILATLYFIFAAVSYGAYCSYCTRLHN